MNAARQIISRRSVLAMGPRLTSPARYASTAVPHHTSHSTMSPKDRQFMRGIFTVATIATAGAVAYGASKSGGRMNSRFVKRNSTLDSNKWFSESQDYNTMLDSKH